MKKLFCILLSVLMLTTAVLAFNSCTPDAPEDSGTTPAVTKTPTPEGYKIFTKETLSFAYPATWTESAEDLLLMDPTNNGNNITIVVTAEDDSHYQWDMNYFNSQYKPMIEAMGLSVSNANLEQKKNNNGIDITKISYTATYMGVSMLQTQYMVTIGEKTYAITVTERQTDEIMRNNVFQTIDKVG